MYEFRWVSFFTGCFEVNNADIVIVAVWIKNFLLHQLLFLVIILQSLFQHIFYSSKERTRITKINYTFSFNHLFHCCSTEAICNVQKLAVYNLKSEFHSVTQLTLHYLGHCRGCDVPDNQQDQVTSVFWKRLRSPVQRHAIALQSNLHFSKPQQPLLLHSPGLHKLLTDDLWHWEQYCFPHLSLCPLPEATGTWGIVHQWHG